jgi:tRNA(His) 5'-end guanylyltransferase
MSELEDRMLKLRDVTSQLKLDKSLPVLAMIDGRSFSKLIKNKFTKPFDPVFMDAMNQVAACVCKEVQGCKLAYVQSDEISFFIDATDQEETPFFEFRLCKLLSIIPSIATGMFNKLLGSQLNKPVEFDCKAWNVNNYNDVFAWFLYRQLDCIKNSKAQTAQTYLPHKQLTGLCANDQIKKLLDEKGIDWNTFDPGMKYGRFIWKETEHFISDQYGEYDRSVWKAHEGWELSKDKEKLVERIERHETDKE